MKGDAPAARPRGERAVPRGRVRTVGACAAPPFYWADSPSVGQKGSVRQSLTVTGGAALVHQRASENFERVNGPATYGLADMTGAADRKFYQFRNDAGIFSFALVNDAKTAFARQNIFKYSKAADTFSIGPKVDLNGLFGEGSNSTTLRLTGINDELNALRAVEINATQVDLMANTNTSGRFDANATAGETRFMLWAVTTGTLRRVKVGAAGSGPGGVGQMLYVN